jgi:hypothetical protein
MANYAVSDVAQILREREWSDWNELLAWLEKQPAQPDRGLSQRDKDELLRDFAKARDEGVELTQDAGELYRTIMTE